MAEAKQFEPRKATVMIKVYPADIVQIMLNNYTLPDLTEEELQKILFAVQTELQSRTEGEKK